MVACFSEEGIDRYYLNFKNGGTHILNTDVTKRMKFLLCDTYVLKDFNTLYRATRCDIRLIL